MIKKLKTNLISFFIVFVSVALLTIFFGIFTKGIIEINWIRMIIFLLLVSSIFIMTLDLIHNKNILLAWWIILSLATILILITFNDFFITQAVLGNLGAG